MRGSRHTEVLAAAAVLTTCGCLLGLSSFHAGARTELEPFDSNTPVQWDSSSAGSVRGLSRYFSSPASHGRNTAPAGHIALRQAGKARTMQLALVSPKAGRLATLISAHREMEHGDSELQRADAGMQALLRGTSLAERTPSQKGMASAAARQQMLMGIGGWGSGEEMDNAGDWEVAMHVDKGCEETLQLRHEGNPGWKRKKLDQNKCDPNKIQNPMMWPFDKPGEVWLHDSSDTSKEPEKFPYDMDALHDNVWDAEQTPNKADGIWHGDGFRRSFDE